MLDFEDEEERDVRGPGLGYEEKEEKIVEGAHCCWNALGGRDE